MAVVFLLFVLAEVLFFTVLLAIVAYAPVLHRHWYGEPMICQQCATQDHSHCAYGSSCPCQHRRPLQLTNMTEFTTPSPNGSDATSGSEVTWTSLE